jgi:hypothetical protein
MAMIGSGVDPLGSVPNTFAGRCVGPEWFAWLKTCAVASGKWLLRDRE